MGLMPKFVEFSREDAGRREGPMFTLQASGLLSLNQAVFAALGEPAAVAVLYDADEGVVGLRKVEASHPNAYTVRKQPGTQTRLVSVRGFTARHQISTVKARRFLAHDYGDGVWGFALREGDAVRNRRGARDEPAVAGTWRHTTNGFDVPAMLHIGQMAMPESSRAHRPEHERPPTMRFGAALACAPLSSSPPTSELRDKFLGFLASPNIWGLVSAHGYVPKGGTWKRLAGRGRITLAAELTGDNEDEAALASTLLLLPDPAVSGYGRDSRYAELFVDVELRNAHGSPAPGMTLDVLHERFKQILAVPVALAAFLSTDLGLDTPGDPPSQAGVLLKSPRGMAELVDTEDLKPLPASAQSSEFLGWAIADPAGESATVTATEMLRQMCDYTLSLDGYESRLEALGA